MSISVYPIEAQLQHGQTNANTGVSGLAIAFGYMPTELYSNFSWVREIMKRIGEFWNFMKMSSIPQLPIAISHSFVIKFSRSFWILSRTVHSLVSTS